MQTHEKIILCALLYLIPGYFLFSATIPAYITVQDQKNQLEKKRQQENELKSQLLQLRQLKKEHVFLENEIEMLRKQVPAKVNWDILTIDLEKLCLSSGLDMVSIQPPEKSKLTVVQPSKVILKSQEKKSASGKHLAENSSEITPQEPDLGKQTMEIKVLGNYASIITFVSKLQSYEQIIELSNLEVAPLSLNDGTKGIGTGNLQASFLLTAYYLP